ncbi:MAG: phage tail sheath subtilisin-like domain-containing protein [Actinomycetota bacterium]
MAEILPGVYIEVRPEALIVSGAVTVGNIGIVGTARQGPLGEVRVLGSYAEAREIFGAYDPFDEPETPNQPPVTLVRALELAYANGASTVFAARVTSTEAKAAGENLIAAWDKNTKARKASRDVATAGGTAAALKAKSHGAGGNGITIAITDAPPNVIVTLKLGGIQEAYTVADGNALVAQVNAGSVIVDATAGAQATGKPGLVPEVPLTFFTGGINGADATDADYKLGLEQLLNENAHIIVAAGQAAGPAIGTDTTDIADALKSHVENASTDKIKRDRIAVVGSRAGATLAQLTSHSVASDRMVFVAPGINTTDAASGKSVTLPGSYAAAAIAGMLSGRDPHVSLTNKTVSVAGLETKFSPDKLEQLVQARVLALEDRRGIRIVKGITTDDGAFRQITTRRIVDFAKFGVRSSAESYIGLLNNDRVRKALKGSINGFLAGMVDDEMLISYELDVTATRDEEIRGIAKVIMTLRPTFSIDFIKVVMFLG